MHMHMLSVRKYMARGSLVLEKTFNLISYGTALEDGWDIRHSFL